MFDSCLSEFGCRRRQGKIQRPVNHDEKILIAEEDAAIFLRNTGDRAAAGPAGAHAGAGCVAWCGVVQRFAFTTNGKTVTLKNNLHALSLTNDRGGK